MCNVNVPGLEKTWKPSNGNEPNKSNVCALPKLNGWSWLPITIIIGICALYNRRKHSNNIFCCVWLGWCVLYASPAKRKKSTDSSIAASMHILRALTKSNKREWIPVFVSILP